MLNWERHKRNQLRSFMSRKTRLIWVTLFTTLILAISSSLSEANDTYNFYFQKAPGPVNVHQGSTSSPSPLVVQNPDGTATLMTPGGAATPTVAAASPELSEMRKMNRLYLAIGYIQIGKTGGENSLAEKTQGKGGLFGKNYSVSLEYDLFDRFAVFVDGYMTAKNYYEPRTIKKSIVNGYAIFGREREILPVKKYYTYALGGAFNLIRSGSPKTAGFSLAAIGGITSIRQIKYSQTTYSEDEQGRYSTYEANDIETIQSPFAGVRARLLMFETAGFDVAYRKILKAKEDSLRLSVAYAF
jgi:hypothetical protein